MFYSWGKNFNNSAKPFQRKAAATANKKNYRGKVLAKQHGDI